MTVAGWGNTVPVGLPSYPDQLLEVNVGLIPQYVCQSAMGGAISTNVNSEMFCAGTYYQGYDSCSGDSGGPIVNRNTGVQLGIVSWGRTECGATGSYGVYTNVSYFTDWINQHTSGFTYEQAVDLGIRNVGEHSRAITFTNIGNSSVSFASGSFSFTQFEASDRIVSNQCDGRTLSQGQSCDVEVSLNVVEAGARDYTLSFDYTQNGSFYSEESRFSLTGVVDASSTLSSSIALPNSGVYSNENEWTVQNGVIKSAALTHNQESMVVIEGVPSGWVTFDLEYATQSDADYFYIEVNGSVKEKFSGDYRYSPWYLQLTESSNQIVFKYVKDGEVSYGSDSVSLSSFNYDASDSPIYSGDSSTSSPSGSSNSGGSLGWLTLALFGLLSLRKRIQ